MNYTLITGASAGIGKVFATQLAKEGCNLILIARRQDKLDSLAKELKSLHGIQVETLSADLATPESSTIIEKQVLDAGWKINGLINNAGFGDRGSFTDIALDRQLQMIQLNVTTLVDLTYRLLPIIKKQVPIIKNQAPSIKKQQGPFIINVASTAAFQAGPNMAIYYATKAFVLSFTEALHEELKADGIAVSALCPGATDSEFATKANMTDTKLFKAGAMTPEAVVKKSLRNKDKAIVITGWKNIAGVWSGKFSPRSVNRKLAGWLQA